MPYFFQHLILCVNPFDLCNFIVISINTQLAEPVCMCNLLYVWQDLFVCGFAHPCANIHLHMFLFKWTLMDSHGCKGYTVYLLLQLGAHRSRFSISTVVVYLISVFACSPKLPRRKRFFIRNMCDCWRRWETLTLWGTQRVWLHLPVSFTPQLISDMRLAVCEMLSAS